MKKILIRAAIALVVLAIVAFVAIGFYANTLVKKSVEKVGPMITKVEIKLDDVNLSLLSGGGSIKGLTVGNPEGYKAPEAIKVGSARMSLSPGSLLADKIVIHEINVQGPEITFETDFKGNNLSKILANIEETLGPSESETKLQVDNFVIKGAKLKVAVTTLGGKSVTVPLPDIHLQNMGQGPEGITAGSLVKQVFEAIESTAVQTAKTAADGLRREAAEAAKSIAEGAASTATGAADQVKKGIGSLFKKSETQK